jgi:hypothetical protein
VKISWGIAMPEDNRVRNTIGIVACVVESEDSKVRLVFDHVRADREELPQRWSTYSFYTFQTYDKDDFLDLHLSEKELADIGLTLVAYLAALSKT